MRKTTCLVIAVALILVSCAPIYVPNTRQTPLLSKAGEFQGAAQYGTSGLDLQAAVAVTNNLALMGNFSYGNRNTDTLNTVTNNYHKHKFFEGAIGYYKNQGPFCFEIFAGYGEGEGTSYGSYSIFYNSSDQLTTGRYKRYFLQPTFGLKKKVVSVAFTPRFSMVDFTEFYESNNPTVKIDIQPKIFIEPSVTARFNFMDNRFFGTLQVGVSQALSGNVYFDYVHFNFSTGMGFRIGGERWTISEKKE